MNAPLAEPARTSVELRLPDADQGWDSGSSSSSVALLSLYSVLVRRYRWRIATAVVVITTAVGLFSLTRPHEYEASAVIRVDPTGQQTLGSNAQPEVSFDALQLMTTELQVITSPAVVLDVIRQAGLNQDPEFNSEALAARAGPQRVSQKTLAAVTSAVSVSQPANSFLLQVGFRSRSPELSSQVANLLVKAFADHEYESRANALQDSSRYMSSQMDALRAQMEGSQQALVDYESTNDVLDPDDKTNVMQARLSQLNEAYNKAQVARVQSEVDDDIVRGGDLDALLTSDRGTDLEVLQTQLESDQRRLANLGQIYGPNYPLLQQQERLVLSDRNLLTDKEQHIAAQIADEYRSRRSQETLLFGLLQQQKQAMDDFNRKAIQYHNLKAKADSVASLYYGLQQRVQDATVGAGLHSEELRVVSPARPSDRPVYPRPLLATALAGLLSTVVCVGLAVVAGALDRTMSSEDEAERWLGIKVIGALPEVENQGEVLRAGVTPAALLPGQAAPAAARGFHEAILSLRSTLQFAAEQRAPVIAVCSSMPGEGKSTISANLARALAATGSRVVLVDADLRKSTVHRHFGIPNRIGLSSVLEGSATIQDAVVASDEMHLSLLPAGPSPASAPRLLQLGFGAVVGALRDRFDHVLIDCPPVLGFADTQIIASLVNSVILVVRAGLTDRVHARVAVRHLLNGHANILGVVLNGVSQRQHSYYSYYGTQYYSGYKDSENEDLDLAR